jgi:protein-tyrosine phosphatase
MKEKEKKHAVETFIMAIRQITYDNLYFEALNCLPNESKPLEEYSKDELIRLINLLKTGMDSLNNNDNKQISQDEKLIENEDFGLGIIAETEQDLQTFQEFCFNNFLPISKQNCHVSSTCKQTMIDHYITTGINHLRTEYAMIILLKNVQYTDLSELTYEKKFSLNNKSYAYQLQILIQNESESNEELLTKIRHNLLGEIFVIDHDDHASIPSLPAPKQPQFVSISSYSQIACWQLLRRRDLDRLHQDLGVTHILTLLNNKEVSHTNICKLIESAGIESIHIPIEGADLSVFTSSQTTIDLLIERLPSVRDLLLNSTITKPIKIIIHCSAGLHRTGTITYLLLRLCQFSMNQSLLIINRTRAITARQVGQKRINAAENNLLGKIS